MLGAHAPCFEEKGFGATSQCSELQALAHVRHKSDSAGLGTATPPDANYVWRGKAKDVPRAQDMLKTAARQAAEKEEKKTLVEKINSNYKNESLLNI